MADEKTISVYDAQVESYVKVVDQAEDQYILIDFINNLKEGDLVLDLGCGPAHASALMRDKGLRVDPVDASREMVKLANNTFDIGARQAAFTDINSVACYEGIWANFSLLHASSKEFPEILKRLHHALKPKGVLHLAMKLGSGTKRDSLGRLYTYYTQAQLCGHLTSAKYSIEEIKLGKARGLAGDVEPWIAVTSKCV